MRSKVLTGLAVFLVALFLLSAAESTAQGNGDSASEEFQLVEYPQYGFGAQFVAPLGGISSRVWLNSRFGFEGDAVIWRSRYSGLGGTLSSRVLYKIVDRETTDFYLAGGGGYDIGSGKISGMGTGGISIALFSSNFKVNLEFGMQGGSDGFFGMSFGSGFHYYF